MFFGAGQPEVAMFLKKKLAKKVVSHRSSNRRRPFRPFLELLEDRTVPSVMVTTNQADYAGGSTAVFTASS